MQVRKLVILIFTDNRVTRESNHVLSFWSLASPDHVCIISTFLTGDEFDAVIQVHTVQ